MDVGFHDRWYPRAHPAAVDDLLLLCDVGHAGGSSSMIYRANAMPRTHPATASDAINAPARRELAYRLTRPCSSDHGVAPVAAYCSTPAAQRRHPPGCPCARTVRRGPTRWPTPTTRSSICTIQHLIEYCGIGVQNADLLSNQAFGQIELSAAQLNHLRPSCAPGPAAPWSFQPHAAAAEPLNGCRLISPRSPEAQQFGKYLRLPHPARAA